MPLYAQHHRRPYHIDRRRNSDFIPRLITWVLFVGNMFVHTMDSEMIQTNYYFAKWLWCNEKCSTDYLLRHSLLFKPQRKLSFVKDAYLVQICVVSNYLLICKPSSIVYVVELVQNRFPAADRKSKCWFCVCGRTSRWHIIIICQFRLI